MNRPIVCSALLTVAGIGLAIGSVVIYERADEQASDDSIADLELIQARVPTVAVDHERVSTDRGTRIVLREPLNIHDSQHLSEVERRYIHNANLIDHVIREAQADERSNCHGWVFAGGRYILAGDDVDLILTENQYAKQISPQPGDLAVYRNNGVVCHTAIVMYVTQGQPVMVRGKWGNLGVFLHPADKSPYGNDYTFYRSPRSGHILVNQTRVIPVRRERSSSQSYRLSGDTTFRPIRQAISPQRKATRQKVAGSLNQMMPTTRCRTRRCRSRPHKPCRARSSARPGSAGRS